MHPGHTNRSGRKKQDQPPCYQDAGYSQCRQARCDREIFLIVFHGPFFVQFCRHEMLETGTVGGVAGDGNIHALLLHDGNTFRHVVGAVAADLGLFAVREGALLHRLEVAGIEIILGFDVGESR